MLRLDVIVAISNFIINSPYKFNFTLLPNVFYRRTGEAVILPFESATVFIADNDLSVDNITSPSNNLDNFLIDVSIDETENNETINIDGEHDIEINVDIEHNNLIDSHNNQLLNKSSESCDSHDSCDSCIDEITATPTSASRSTQTMKTIVQNLNNDITKLRQSLDEVNHVFNFKHDILDFIYEKNDILEIKNVNPSAYYNIMSIEDDKDIVSIPLYIDMDLENNLLFYFDEEMIEEPQSWRAGKIGTLYCSKDSLRKFYNIKRITKDFLNKLKTEILTNIGNHFVCLSAAVVETKI